MYHSFTDVLIHTQAKTTLAQHLWPETLQAEYSLQHCQGDGVLFTGELAPADLLRIIPHLHALTASMTRALLRLVSERPSHPPYPPVQPFRLCHVYC
ncbi:MAG TPA: hypothetical protein VGL07_19205 [Buttiauxella sp.]|jgi:hypothetical protein